MPTLDDWPDHGDVCRWCRHKGRRHRDGGCVVGDCKCPGFAATLTKADVITLLRQARSEGGRSFGQVVAALGFSIEEANRILRGEDTNG